jgi:predicted aspartyl protease
VITGVVSPEGVPTIHLQIGRSVWPTIVDTGFNGDVELPESLKTEIDAIPIGVVQSILAAGKVVDEDCFLITIEFDGELRTVEATFAPVNELLIGTGLMSQHHLEVDFPTGTVRLFQTRTEN